MRKHRTQRGTQVVEFAIILPLLGLLALVVAEGANLFRVHQLITNAAREGARLAIQPQNGPSGTPSTTCTFTASATTTTNPVCNGVATYLQNNRVIGNIFVQCGSVTISLNQDDVVAGIGYSKVQTTCPYQLQYLPRLLTWGSPVPIASTSTYRNLY